MTDAFISAAVVLMMGLAMVVFGPRLRRTLVLPLFRRLEDRARTPSIISIPRPTRYRAQAVVSEERPDVVVLAAALVRGLEQCRTDTAAFAVKFAALALGALDARLIDGKPARASERLTTAAEAEVSQAMELVAQDIRHLTSVALRIRHELQDAPRPRGTRFHPRRRPWNVRPSESGRKRAS